MKVLVGHNRYRSATPSGENRAVELDIELLRAAGVSVVPFLEESDELAEASPAVMASAALGPIVSPRGVRRLRMLIDEHRPDVVHLHNVFPLISPWAVRTACRASLPVVQTVHNYRHTCIAGVHLRSGHVCLDCVEAPVPWPGVRHACYRGSRTQSAVMAVGQVVHRSTWRRLDALLVTSPAMTGLLEDIGIPRERTEWRPSCAPDHGPCPSGGDGGVVFVGRLDDQKGLRLLLAAWTPEVASRCRRLQIAGDGPLADVVRSRAASDPTILFHGRLEADGVREAMAGAAAIVVPSLSFEGFPLVAAEAMALGRPLLISSVTGLSAVAEWGAARPVEPTAAAWTSALLGLDEGWLGRAAVAARSFYEAHCSPAASTAQLLRIYHAVMARSR